jgi:hypothetical protein
LFNSFIYIFTTKPIIAVLFGITFGFLWLSTVPPTMGIVGFIFGTKYIGLLYGIVFLSHQVGSFFGAYLEVYFMIYMALMIMHGIYLLLYQFLQV